MASGLRASRLKKNKSGLKKRVFGPVEQARNERLSAKLMALASQPKPTRPEMEVGESQNICLSIFSAMANNHCLADEKEAEAEGAAKTTAGSSFSVPSFVSVFCEQPPPDTQLPTAPNTPELHPMKDVPSESDAVLYHLLGLFTDRIGFAENGEPELSFGE